MKTDKHVELKNGKQDEQGIWHSTEQGGVTRRTFAVGAGALGVAGLLGSIGLVGCSPTNSPAESAGSGDTEVVAYDLVVIGSGGSGMAAAITAREAGIENIVILEKMMGTGGNTSFSSSGMNASETRFEKEQGIEDSNEWFAQETFEGGHEQGNRELIDFLCNNSAGAIDWLDEHGITLDNLTQMAGMSVKRTHRPTDGSAVGKVLVAGLRDVLDSLGIETITECEVTSLVRDDDGVIVGVEALQSGKNARFDAKAVVLATGGLGANEEMVVGYRPDLAGYVTTNQLGTTGDGYVMAENAGAQLIQMENIQIHPTVVQEPTALVGESVRGSGGVLINSEGARFIDELKTRDVVSAAILEQSGDFAWLIFDQAVMDANKSLDIIDSAGSIDKGSNLENLATAIQVDPAALKATFDAYNSITSEGIADEFGRTTGLAELAIDGPMYAIKVAPGIHHSMGGVKVNVKSEALDTSEKPIPGLFAAGEVTGGIHGANRIGGNAVCDIMVYGRNAGASAANYIKA